MKAKLSGNRFKKKGGLESKVEMHHEKKCRVEKHLNERGRKEIASKYGVRMNFDILVCS
jgi:hypothetical protein